MTNELTAPPSMVLSGHCHCPHHKLIPRWQHIVCLQACMHVCILPLGQLPLARSVCWCLVGYLTLLETSFTFLFIASEKGERRARSWRRAGDNFLNSGRQEAREPEGTITFLVSHIFNPYQIPKWNSVCNRNIDSNCQRFSISTKSSRKRRNQLLVALDCRRFRLWAVAASWKSWKVSSSQQPTTGRISLFHCNQLMPYYYHPLAQHLNRNHL